jgi:hypothetical protein
MIKIIKLPQIKYLKFFKLILNKDNKELIIIVAKPTTKITSLVFSFIDNIDIIAIYVVADNINEMIFFLIIII